MTHRYCHSHHVADRIEQRIAGNRSTALQIKSAKEQLTTIQDFLQKDKADSYTRTEAIKDFGLRDQMIQRLEAKVEAELDTLRARPGSRE